LHEHLGALPAALPIVADKRRGRVGERAGQARVDAGRRGMTDMIDADIDRVLSDPIAQQLLNSRELARLAYTGADGSPRVVPIGFDAEDREIVMYSEPSTSKVKALARDPRVALTIDVGGTPSRALLLRGRAKIDIHEASIDNYLDCARRYVYASDWAGFEAGVRALYKTMARISLAPSWAKILDEKR
jgi:hypothetical protein